MIKRRCNNCDAIQAVAHDRTENVHASDRNAGAGWMNACWLRQRICERTALEQHARKIETWAGSATGVTQRELEAAGKLELSH